MITPDSAIRSPWYLRWETTPNMGIKVGDEVFPSPVVDIPTFVVRIRHAGEHVLNRPVVVERIAIHIEPPAAELTFDQKWGCVGRKITMSGQIRRNSIRHVGGGADVVPTVYSRSGDCGRRKVAKGWSDVRHLFSPQRDYKFASRVVGVRCISGNQIQILVSSRKCGQALEEIDHMIPGID